MSDQKHVHFVGICGSGMAAAAALMKEKGFKVTGSDTGVYPPMSRYLENEGIPFATAFDPSNLVPRPDLVVIGNAISRGNAEVEEVLDLKIPYLSLPELLKAELIRGKRSLVVAGTHGKTTITSLLTWVLEKCGREPSFFVGGIPLNFGRGAKLGAGPDVVLEGDEYDSAFFDKRPKFLCYSPDLVIINNIEFDHADIYDDLGEIEKAFASLPRLVPRKGLIVANGDDPVVRRVLEKTFSPVEWYGLKKGIPWHVSDIEATGEGIDFSIRHNGESMGRLSLPLMGEHNALNAGAVFIACRWLGVPRQAVESGFESFQGVRRRMERKGTMGGAIVFDDFAHHPTSIAKTISAVERHYPEHPIWAVFEPRSNTTRRNHFQKELARAFQKASRVIIGAVYREEKIDPAHRLDPSQLASDIEREFSTEAHYIPDVETIVDFLTSRVRKGEVILVMSNGGFGGILDRLMAP
jgi:UDP-N-acetylmuramate: L-alanyl-gamma-D-glutamyl-meso-diaminopimelate ligase